MSVLRSCVSCVISWKCLCEVLRKLPDSAFDQFDLEMFYLEHFSDYYFTDDEGNVHENDPPVIFMAVDCKGGRTWRSEEGEKPLLLRPDSEPTDSPRYIFREKDVRWLQFECEHSYDRLTAEKREDGLWTFTLSVLVRSTVRHERCNYMEIFNRHQLPLL